MLHRSDASVRLWCAIWDNFEFYTFCRIVHSSTRSRCELPGDVANCFDIWTTFCRSRTRCMLLLLCVCSSCECWAPSGCRNPSNIDHILRCGIPDERSSGPPDEFWRGTPYRTGHTWRDGPFRVRVPSSRNARPILLGKWISYCTVDMEQSATCRHFLREHASNGTPEKSILWFACYSACRCASRMRYPLVEYSQRREPWTCESRD